MQQRHPNGYVVVNVNLFAADYSIVVPFSESISGSRRIYGNCISINHKHVHTPSRGSVLHLRPSHRDRVCWCWRILHDSYLRSRWGHPVNIKWGGNLIVH